MADYSEALDPAYTTLEFENMQVLPLGAGECHISSAAFELWNFYWFKTLVGRGECEFWREVIKGVICPSAPARREMILFSGLLLSPWVW